MGRDPERVKSVAEEATAAGGGGRVHGHVADLALMSNVRGSDLAACDRRGSRARRRLDRHAQSLAIDGLDSVACREGITREQLVVNLIRHG